MRRLATGLLCLHLFCLVIAPCAWPPPSSNLARGLATIFLPYLKLFALDNGYRFFAPDPGPSHLVRYELLDDQGSVIAEGKFPDREQHWPRLLYHRHFMVAETINAEVSPYLDAPTDPPMTDRQIREFQSARDESFLLPRSVAQYLLRQNPEARKARLFLRRHLIPSPFDLIRGIKLDASSLYREVSLGEFEAAS